MRGEEREAEDQERKEGQGRLGRLEPPGGPRAGGLASAPALPGNCPLSSALRF